MTDDIKRQLRSEFMQRSKASESPDVELKMAVLAGELNALIHPSNGMKLACFFPHQHEPDLSEWYRYLISQGVKLAFPCFEADEKRFAYRWISDFNHDFSPGEYGILAPKSTTSRVSESDRLKVFDHYLVPGLLFDHFGSRLGRGKGIYDRLLAGTSGPKIGVAYHWQLVSHIPHDPWDIAMDYIATDICSYEIMQR